MTIARNERAIDRRKPAKSSGTVPAQKRIIELDGLRGIAILLVLCLHSNPLTGPLTIFQVPFAIGWIGVDLFFVLSGFLITGILVDTAGERGYYGNFIVRRTLRIFPAYYGTLLLGCALTYWPGKILWSEFFLRDGGAWFATFTGNFFDLRLKDHWPGGLLTPLWSLQIEEQFYLAFPLLVAVTRRGTLKKVLLALILAALVVRIVLTQLWPDNLVAAYVMMPARMDALAMGGIVALAIRDGGTWLRDWRIPWATAVCGVAFVRLWWVTGGTPWPAAMRGFGYTLDAAAFAGILILLLVWKPGWMVRVCRTRLLTRIGTISYGLYLLHPLIAHVIRTYVEPGLGVAVYGSADTVLVILGSIGAAFLSWTFFEKPILSLRNRLTVRKSVQAASAI